MGSLSQGCPNKTLACRTVQPGCINTGGGGGVLSKDCLNTALTSDTSPTGRVHPLAFGFFFPEREREREREREGGERETEREKGRSTGRFWAEQA